MCTFHMPLPSCVLSIYLLSSVKDAPGPSCMRLISAAVEVRVMLEKPFLFLLSILEIRTGCQSPGCYLHSLALSDREGNGTPLQYSCLENPMDRGAW